MALAAIVLAGACADRSPSAVPVNEPVAPPGAMALRCAVAVRAGTLSCAPEGGGAASGVRGVVLGGQGINVRLTSSGISYNAATQTLRTDVTVQNLTTQPLGTTDGRYPAPEGVQVFFHQKPTVTNGEGTVTVANPDGLGVFTSSNQPYFQYAGVLLPGDTSAAREWRFDVPPTVNTFVFRVYVYAPVPNEAGWVALSPIAPSIAVGDTMRLDASVWRVTGQVAAGQAVTWTTSNPAVATVDPAGVVTATGPGSATITATSGARWGRVTVAVTAASEAPPPTIVSFTVSPVDVTANGADTTWAEVHVRSPVGVWQVWAGLLSPAGNLAQCFANWVSGTSSDAVYRCPMVIADGASHGLWTGVVWASNPTQRNMSVFDLSDAGSAARVSVRSPHEDVTPPVLTGLAFAPDTARAGDTVTVEVSFTDAGVGAAGGGLRFSAAEGFNEFIGCSGDNRVSGTPNAGTFRCTFVVPAGARPGRWDAFVNLLDANNNIGYTPPQDLQAAGFPSTLVVIAPDSP